MNRFLLMPKLKPEFKMAQPLPVFLGISTVKHDPAGAPETLARNFGRKGLPMLFAATKMQPFTTVRNSTS